MAKKPEYGLLIDYEYCTGCFACQVACAQEYNWPAGMGGIRVMEIVENLPKDKHYLKFMPMPTELCVLCAGRTAKRKQPACVQTCMAACMKFGRIEDLAKEITKPRMVLWAPRASGKSKKSEE
jgi:Fe-S-cluster-containing dehydrogenase component